MLVCYCFMLSTEWTGWTYGLDRLLDGIRFMHISMDYRKHSFGIRAKSPAGNWMRCTCISYGFKSMLRADIV